MEIPERINLNEIESECWNLLVHGCLKGKEPFHTFVLATNSESGVDLRTVVLRKVDLINRLIFFHTDIRSQKVNQLRNTNQPGILFYDPARRIQLRMKSEVQFHSDDETANQIWKETRISARKYYLSGKSPGDILENSFDSLPDHLHGFDPSEEESESGRENFLAISLKITQMDWLFLCSQGHKRAIYNYKENGFVGNWINP